jgi:SLT domain-containing protein
MKLTTKERDARIAHIRWNAKENDRRLAGGKITRQQWKRCDADGKRAIAELHGLENGQGGGR